MGVRGEDHASDAGGDGTEAADPQVAPVLLHGALGLDALLADARTGLLTGVVDWDLRLGPERLAVQADLATLL